MNFTLIFKDGKIMTFYIEECARVYQQAYGGTLIPVDILEEKVSKKLRINALCKSL